MHDTATTSLERTSHWLDLPLWLRWGGIVVFNTAVALFLTAIGFGGSLGVNWLFSQCIGLTIYLLFESALRWLSPGPGRIAAFGGAIAVGSLAGTLLASLAIGSAPLRELPGAGFWQSTIVGVLFGSIFVALATYHEHTLRMERNLRREQMRHLRAENARIETELRLLQAQVEPHFLFNTFALVRSDITREPARGRDVLDHLIAYLRASLSHSRREHASLDDELRLLDDYLAIMRQRMRERLSVHVDVTAAARLRSFPPMLLQPLVENAIRHGLEPHPGGGTLTITGREEDNMLRIEISDDGAGLDEASEGGGTGLANVSARLQSRYRDRAHLSLHENTAGGVTAELTVPLT